MRRGVVALAAIFLLAANLLAGDPWKEKSYKQWDEKDVRRVLTDSPWVKEVRVEASWQRGSGSSPDRPTVGQSSNPAGGGYGQGGLGSDQVGGLPSGGRPGETQPGGDSPQARFVVRWASARTMRQALARSAVLRGSLQEADADKLLAQELAEYAVVVLGPDMTPFAKAEEKGLAEKAYLMVKKNKTKLPPARVEIQRAQSAADKSPAAGGQAVSAVVFYFARKSDSGEAAIAADEKSVEFACEAGGARIKTSFEPQKMAGAQGPDW